MPIADIIARNLATMTPQQIADFALNEERELRRARARNDVASATSHESELQKFVAEMNKRY